ncbi:MAG TPA: Rid family detoxifying hydrolase [Candidatus Limnocylindrales bacterium]|nr:Rid family detoxifying hydrolase [Candidatus Limnocylindrales bacterium]
MRAIKTASAPGAVASYSQAIDTGSLVFTAGQVGLDPATGQLVDGGIEAQAERALTNIVAVLDAAGLSMADVVKTSCFLSDIANFEAFNAVYSRFVGDPPPARSTFAVAGLPRGALIEIEAIAART